MKKGKKLALYLVTGALCLSAAGCSKDSGSGGSGGADARHTYSWWSPNGEDASYYDSYEKNPSIEYMMTRDYKDEDGKDTKINIKYEVPASGQQENALNTMISTGDYTDVINISIYKGSIVDLYDQGIVQDITSYVEDYMPNYMAYLEKNPDMKLTATNLVNGEKKFLQLYAYNAQLRDQWTGWCYRRDWLVKYGANPNDGSAFSGEYTVKKEDGSFDLNSWVDNVVFPSGGSDPIYISDWEWMFEIFQKAIQEQGITDGYCISRPYTGSDMGNLVSAFGGGGTGYYINDDTIEYGMYSDDFRTYLKAMNTWYKNGWIDEAFAEHANDMFYKIDDAKVRQGKVGLWQGITSQLIGNIATDEGFAKDMVVYAARIPINDLYGSDEQKNVEPYTFYQEGLEGASIVITDKANEKDIIALFSYLDYCFSEEGNLLKFFGLSKEQYEITQNELYTREGLTEGAYTVTEREDGIKEIELVDKLKQDGGLANAAKSNRVFGLGSIGYGYKLVNSAETETYRHNIDEWIAYINRGFFFTAFRSQLSSEDAVIVSKTETNLDEFSKKSVPGFIMGDKDPFNDKDWDSFKKALGKYNPDKAKTIFQNLLDQLKE